MTEPEVARANAITTMTLKLVCRIVLLSFPLSTSLRPGAALSLPKLSACGESLAGVSTGDAFPLRYGPHRIEAFTYCCPERPESRKTANPVEQEQCRCAAFPDAGGDRDRMEATADRPGDHLVKRQSARSRRRRECRTASCEPA